MRMNSWRPVATFVVVLISLVAGFIGTAAHAQVLKAVKDRGTLNCGVRKAFMDSPPAITAEVEWL